REVRWQLAARFGGVVVDCLAVLAISGLALALQHLGAPADLVSAAYGRILLAKLGLVAVALALAVVATRVKPGDADLWRHAEAVVLLGVLALAGLLVSLPPPI